MKIKCKLVKTQEIRTLGDFKVSLIFKPTQDEWKDKIQLKLTTPDPYSDTELLGLPSELDDVIILEMTTKEIQTKLDKPEKKVKT